MNIKGLQKLTLLDYPDRLACTVFLGGCNFRCPFCHNASLVLPDMMGEDMSADDFFAFLDSRVGRIDAVCISGGEPTLMPDLPDFIREIKARGFLVKLDTNGSNPEMLSVLIDSGLLDYVAMDIKNSPEKYAETIGLSVEKTKKILEQVKKSASILMEGRVDFEFRTTVMPELHSETDMIEIGRWLSGDEKFFLQSYREEGDQIVGGFTPPTSEELSKLLYELKRFIPNANVRR